MKFPIGGVGGIASFAEALSFIPTKLDAVLFNAFPLIC